MPSSEVSLLQMPKDPMKYISEYLDFPSILVLRKVSHDLQNFIDDTKPASHLTEIDVNVNSGRVSFTLKSKTFYRNEIVIGYEKNEEACLVRCFKDGKVKKTMIENEDFVTLFCKDFDIILRHQKTELERFRIRLDSLNSTVKEKILESVNKSLKSMNHLLQVKLLSMEVSNHNEILSILPYIDPKPLEHISIHGPSIVHNILNLDEIGQLEQWKQADVLSNFGFQLPYPAQNLKHFSTINLNIVSTEDLFSLKEMFLCSSTLTTIKIYYYENISNDVISQKLIESFGHPFFDNNRDGYWYFRTSDTNQLLRITVPGRCTIEFNRIEQSDVPQNAIILN